MDRFWQDVRYGARNLLKYPVSCAVAIASLAAGIGATTATLTVRDAVFHKAPALYRNPGELSIVQVGSRERPIRGNGGSVPAALYALWRDSGIGGAAAAPEQVRDVRVGDRTENVRIRAVTPNFFATLGVEPAMGRTFIGDAARTGPTPAVLSYRVWKFFLEARPDAIGQQIWIGADPHVIVGVLPERFWFSMMDSPIWTPLPDEATTPDARVEVVVRRDAGVTERQLADRLQPGLAQYVGSLPAAERGLQLRVSRLEGTPVGNAVMAAFPYVLAIAVLLTLFIACANVAILVIAQWTAREHEIAIRASLGASRGRIVRGLIVESLLMAAAGGLLGIGATYALVGIITRNSGPALEFFDLAIDPLILVEAILVTLVTGIAAGIGPALLETRRLQGNPMRAIATSDRVRQRWRHALVLVEIAVTVALLVVTGGMIDAYRRNYRIDVGYRTHPLVLLRVESGQGVQIPRIVEAVKRVPGVARAAASTTVPFIAQAPLQRVSEQPGSPAVRAERGVIDQEFFATLDVPIRKGRAFTAQDSPQTRTAIVNETLATRVFGGADPIGHELWIGQTSYEVVGVVADYKNTALQNREWDPKVFLPLGTRSGDKQMSFLIRASGEPAAVERAVRRAIPNAVAGHVVVRSVTLDQIIDVSGQEILVGTAPLAPLIATGMLLTAAGIYGVLAFSIARRSKELALRIAIGATRGNVVRLVAAHSMRLVLGGTLCGAGATFALSRIGRAVGVEGSFLDPAWTSFAIPALIVAAIGLLATLVPTRRATKIEPATLLRTT